jgi:hypothetical protein
LLPFVISDEAARLAGKSRQIQTEALAAPISRWRLAIFQGAKLLHFSSNCKNLFSMCYSQLAVRKVA